MEALIVVDSRYGNTERVAHAIADGLASRYATRVSRAGEADLVSDEAPELLVVGGPTQRRHLSPGLRAVLDALPRNALRGVRAAAFDTRYRMSRSLTGSAARDAAKRLRKAGCRLVARPESFFMEKDVPPKGEKRRHGLEGLEPGELERAGEWGRRLAERTAAG